MTGFEPPAPAGRGGRRFARRETDGGDDLVEAALADAAGGAKSGPSVVGAMTDLGPSRSPEPPVWWGEFVRLVALARSPGTADELRHEAVVVDVMAETVARSASARAHRPRRGRRRVGRVALVKATALLGVCAFGVAAAAASAGVGPADVVPGWDGTPPLPPSATTEEAPPGGGEGVGVEASDPVAQPEPVTDRPPPGAAEPGSVGLDGTGRSESAVAEPAPGRGDPVQPGSGSNGVPSGPGVPDPSAPAGTGDAAATPDGPGRSEEPPGHTRSTGGRGCGAEPSHGRASGWCQGDDDPGHAH